MIRAVVVTYAVAWFAFHVVVWAARSRALVRSRGAL